MEILAVMTITAAGLYFMPQCVREWIWPRPFEKLTRIERAAVDAAYRALVATLREDGLDIAADERAEAVIDAIATGIMRSRDE